VKSTFFVVIGVALGFLLAHRVSRTAVGARIFSEVDTRAKAFTGAVADGYRSREAELRADPED
jgi:hypothetical protein